MTPLERDLQTVVAMLFEAHRDRDPLLIQAAMRQLDFLDTLARFSVYEDRQ